MSLLAAGRAGTTARRRPERGSGRTARAAAPADTGARRGPRRAAAPDPAQPPGRGHRSAFSTLLDVTDPAELRTKVEGIVDRVITANGFAVTRDERARLVEELIGEVGGLGPLEPLLADETVTEIMVNGPNHLYIERGGKILRVDTVFLNDEHVLRIIDRIITPLGRRIDQSSPRVDARLPDGSRVNAIIEPLSLDRPGHHGPEVPGQADHRRRPDPVRDGDARDVRLPAGLHRGAPQRLRLGRDGLGQDDDCLNVLSSFIPDDERIVTIEDAAELQLRQAHVLTLEARPPNLEGKGEITIRDLLRNAMHMRPDRIIVGECRSGEALDMLQAMTTGHDGSLSTGHANTPPDMLRRLETMVLMTGYELPLRAIREQIASAVDLIVHTARLKDGSRKIINITEVYGIEDDEILTQDIFAFEQTGVSEDGKIEGELKPTGIRPTFMGVFKASGVDLPPGEFGIPLDRPGQAGLDAPRQGPLGRRRAGGSAPRWSDRRSATGGRSAPAGWSTSRRSARSTSTPGSSSAATIKDQTRQCLTNLKAKLEAAGSSLDKVVWANWALREPSEFDMFNEEWVALVPGRHADRPGDADAAAPAPGRVPRLDRGHRRGVAAARPVVAVGWAGFPPAGWDSPGRRSQPRMRRASIRCSAPSLA